jgi:hypothetical protein
VARIGDRRGAFRDLVGGGASGKETTWKTKAGWKDNITNGSFISGKGLHELDWSGSGQGQVVDSCECSNEPSGSIRCRGFLE